ncbi:hypothetical protein AMTRI_Chr09g18150 [Amborella trichopoda]
MEGSNQVEDVFEMLIDSRAEGILNDLGFDFEVPIPVILDEIKKKKLEEKAAKIKEKEVVTESEEVMKSKDKEKVLTPDKSAPPLGPKKKKKENTMTAPSRSSARIPHQVNPNRGRVLNEGAPLKLSRNDSPESTSSLESMEVALLLEQHYFGPDLDGPGSTFNPSL